jgi:hypothetical protein
LHLSREVAARKHAGSLSEAVRNLVGIHAVKSNSNPESRTPHAIIHENELSLLRLRNIREEALWCFGMGPAV